MENGTKVRWYALGARQRRLPSPADRLRRAEPADFGTQEAVDHLTRLAGEALNVLAVCVSLVDRERRLLNSSYGLPVPTALLISHALWKHVVATRRPLVIADGRSDPVVARNPSVRDGTVRACVGMPLRSADGGSVGTLLAMDQKARRWTAPQLDLLTDISRLIVRETELGAVVRRASLGGVSSQSIPVK